MLAIILFSFSACDNDDDYMPPNQDIITALKQLYPDVQDIEWSQKGVYYVADCWVNGSELDVWFDANANWIMTEMEIFREQLPAYGGLLLEKDITDADDTHWPDVE